MIRLPILFVLIFLFRFSIAQVPLAIASGSYQDVKYVLIMADNVKMAYDGTNMKKLGGSLFDVADKAFYNGKYINAAARYREAFKLFPTRSSGLAREFDVSAAALQVDYSTLDMLNARVYAGGLNTMGIYFHNLGQYDKALEFYDLSMKIRATRLGKTSAAFMNSLHNIALIKKELGEYAEAEHIFNYLDKVIPQLFTENSSHYAIFLNNKAMLYATLGRNEEALILLNEAIKKGKEHFHENYFDLERLYVNQGFLLLKTGQFELAKTALLRAEGGMREKEYLKHPDFNDLMIYIGRLYIETGSSEALGYIESAIDGAKQRYGDSHLLYAKALENKALYFLKSQNYEYAKIEYTRIAEIRKDQLGEENRDYLSINTKIALCEWELGNINNAKKLFENSSTAYIQLLDQLFPAFSENEKADLWSSIKPDLYLFMSFVKHNHTSNSDLIKYALNIHLRTKGILINSTSSIREVVFKSGDDDLITIYKDWKETKDLLAYYYSVPKEQVSEDKIDINELETEANDLEKSLSRRSALFAGGLEQFKDYTAEISNSLVENEGALEIVRIETKLGRDAGKPFYMGFLIKGSQTSPELITLQNSTELEGKYLKLYKNKILFKLDDRDSYNNFWQAFSSPTEGIKHLYISLDGIYNNVSITSLQDESGGYLVDKRNWTMVANSRMIPKIKQGDNGLKVQNAVLFGNPDFGEALNVSPLPGTGIEVDQISKLLNEQGYLVSAFTGAEASEQNIIEINSPSVLHLATHGYFLSDVKVEDGMILGIQVNKAKNNPLLRSGIMLSNSDKNSEGDINLKKSNGLLNAFETASLNLNGTGLVVLSACETGKGEIVNGEGVYGLPRALQVAGAKNVIMSLWKVDDAVTQELMIEFYKLWVGGENLNSAFLSAQRSIKEKYQHPYYWGAFVLLEN